MTTKSRAQKQASDLRDIATVADTDAQEVDQAGRCSIATGEGIGLEGNCCPVESCSTGEAAGTVPGDWDRWAREDWRPFARSVTIDQRDRERPGQRATTGQAGIASSPPLRQRQKGPSS